LGSWWKVGSPLVENSGGAHGSKSRNSAVGIVTRYGLDDKRSEFESR
jgi:hypothetical protein